MAGSIRSSSVRSGVRSAGGEAVDRPHLLHPQRAPGALVGERGVDEAVEQHERAPREQRREQLLHELCARGRVQQRLGARRDRQRGVLDERANPLGQRRPRRARAAARTRMSPRGELARERPRERRLAGAVDALDRDQLAARHGGHGSGSTMAGVTLRLRPPALPGIDAHPHARAVLDARAAPRRGALARLPLPRARRAPASARSRARSRPRCSPTGARDPDAVAERVARGTHPDLTWVTPSGAAEMLVGDIEEPVVAAATRTPFESARRVFVIEGADTMNDQAANRMLKTLEEPPPFVHLSC